jgi:preprotein translocase subunit SecF
MQRPIIKLRKVWFALSGALVVASVVVLYAFPLKFGIDFTGGSLLEVEFSKDRPAPAEVGAVVAGLGLGESVAQTVGDRTMLIRLETLDEAKHQKVLSSLTASFGDVSERSFESIGPTVGDELRRKAVWSVALVLLAIATYVSYAFRQVTRPVASWKYGLVTLIVGLLHDVLLPVAAFALLGHYTIAEVNSAFVAAVLTVLGFSVHDTIVVFDRIRENLMRSGGAFEAVVEKSVNDTLARSVNTSLTALLPMIAVWFWGGESLKHFAFTLGIGILAGTYSSVFLASPLLVAMQPKEGRK